MTNFEEMINATNAKVAEIENRMESYHDLSMVQWILISGVIVFFM